MAEIDLSQYDLGPQRSDEDKRTYILRLNGERQRYQKDLKAVRRSALIANGHGVAGGKATKEKATDGTMGGIKPKPAADPGEPGPIGQRPNETDSTYRRSKLSRSTRRPGHRGR